ncbi:MAG: cyclic nucleotide-binding domain-containing protein [Spirochaetales bacterium]|nr:cyclic nucleotide-binding domain-containing protein [Spirochaetales bacterium]
MPRPMQYKANSVVYFKGDSGDRIYILKSGKVSLRYNDIETGQELRDLIQTGEFFGVKSALGRYPREETAMVLQDSDMIVFSVPEFEAFVSKNTRIITKMLTVFSNQLRRIHKQVQNLLSAGRAGQEQNPEQGLYKIGEYYAACQKFPQALYVFKRYLTYYPSGRFASQANTHITELEQKLSQGGTAQPSIRQQPVTTHASLTPAAKQYYDGVSLFSQQKFQDALRAFKLILEKGDDPEYVAKSNYEIGRCLYSMGSFDNCIAHYQNMIQQYPKHPDLIDALYYVGSSYEKKGVIDKAKGFYTKILSMASDSLPVYRRTKKALRGLEA